MKKKILALLSAVVMIVPFLQPTGAAAVNFTPKTTLKSESAMVINLDCNTVIHEKNADTRQLPGPLVNIMTAVVCLEECKNLTEEVTIDESVYSDLYDTEYRDDLRFAEIYDGDVLTYTDLLYAMMLTSSIEASSTLAYKIGGGKISTFVQKMNDKAAELGLTNTHFTNPTGMYDPDQYTTARDMAKLTQYALKVSVFDKICSTYSYNPSVPNFTNHPNRQAWVWYHSNIMMDRDSDYYYAGTKGIKTANIEMGGRNIVTTASRDGNNYLVVCLKSPMSDESGNNAFYHIEDATNLFIWAFSHFSYQIVLADTAELGEVNVTLANGNDYVLARPKEEISMLWYDEIDMGLISRDNIKWYNETLQAPVKKGDLLGTVTLEYSGEELATVDLVAVSDVERSSAKYQVYAASLFPKSSWFKKSFIVAGLLGFLYIFLCLYAFIIFKNKSKPVKPKYAVPKVEKKKKNRPE